LFFGRALVGRPPPPRFGRARQYPGGTRSVSPTARGKRGAATKERALKSPPRRPAATALSETDIIRTRELAALFGIPEMCPEPACKRARACRARGAPCLARFRDTYRDLVTELAAWPALFDEDEWWMEP
jgi:hypothetical protein